MGQLGVAPSAIGARAEESGGTTAWQRRLLPFMASMVVLLAILAVASNFYQAHVMQQFIGTPHEVDLKPAWEPVAFDKTSTLSEQLAWAQWQTLALLESQALRSRYHQASVILMVRVYIIFIGFATGVAMALIGAAFILGKLQEPVSTVNTGAGAWRFAIQSSSPGLILAMLGTILILTTIWSRSEIDVQDKTLYVSSRVTDVSTPASTAKSPQAAQDEILTSVRKAEEAKTKK